MGDNRIVNVRFCTNQKGFCCMNEKPKVGLFFLVGDSWWGQGSVTQKRAAMRGSSGKWKMMPLQL